jgi:hypothetical protein
MAKAQIPDSEAVMGNFTNTEKAKEADREVGYRKYVYPRRVMDKKMTQEQADRQIAIMQEIAEEYSVLAVKERLV